MTESTGPLRVHQLSLEADPENRARLASEARREVRSTAARWGVAGEALNDMTSIAGELLANVADHAGSGQPHATLSLEPAERRLHIEIADECPRGPAVTARIGDDRAEEGRGLLMVDALADEWGVDRSATGKVVWADLLDVPVAEDAGPESAGPEEPAARSRDVSA
ncbi:Anti-sigma regulatory factor (Ser/Thr protein kinase) [Streptomyces sp. TLI_053]|uniref:ATP-binding protein n=1 Tax=Streptomyces sp. TLI_053 TaxID=1855352 RepID=UPI000879EAB8|nr:ATP-binding protein [Streptomyces sp. TLI_053]SDT82717.1 Anti-sigma regulatory factor (Ser/Thr protein kinase) [Streptomyces sp. TLI_053]